MSEEKRHTPFQTLIAERMSQLGIRSLEEFGKRFGITRGTIYTLYSGRISTYGTPVRPSVETLVALSRALQKPLYELIHLLGPDAIGQKNFDDIEMLMRARTLLSRRNMLLDFEVPSRLNPELIDLYAAGWTSDVSRNLADSIIGNALVTKVGREDADLEGFSALGDSMASGAHPVYSGDILIIDKSDRAEPSDLVVIQLEDGAHLCRLLYGSRYIATNPLKTDLTPSEVAESEARLIGRVVEIRHAFKRNSSL